MATKARNAGFPSFAQVQTSLRKLQKEGEKLAGRVRRDVLGLISKDQRKAVENLLDQAARVRKDIQKRAEKALKDLEARAEKLRKRIETQAEKGFDPVIRRLNLPSRRDIDTLAKRLSNLEKRVDDLSTHRAA